MPTQLSSSSSRLDSLRRELDAEGFYQLLVPDSRSLVEALLHRIKKLQCETKEGTKSSIPQELVGKQSLQSRSTEDGVKVVDAAHVADQALQSDKPSFKSKYEEEKEKNETLKRALLKAKSCVEVLRQEADERTKTINQLMNKQRAKVVVDESMLAAKASLTLTKPLRAPSTDGSDASRSERGKKNEDLEMAKVYETRLKQEQRETQRLKTRLQEAQGMLKRVKSELRQQDKPTQFNEEKSSYVLKLISENNELRRRISQFEDGEQQRASSSSSSSKGYISSFEEPTSPVVKRSNKKRVKWRSCENVSLTDDDGELEKQQRLLEVHEPCRRRRQMESTLDKLRSHKHFHVTSSSSAVDLDCYTSELENRIDDLYERLEESEKDKFELEMRVEELRGIKDKLEASNEELQEKIQILLKKHSPHYENVENVVKLVERQRDVYKRSVERLLSKLSPQLRQNVADSRSCSNDIRRSSNGGQIKSRNDDFHSYGTQNSTDHSAEEALHDALENSRRVLQESYNEERYTSKQGSGREVKNATFQEADDSALKGVEINHHMMQTEIEELMTDNELLRKRIQAMQKTIDDLRQSNEAHSANVSPKLATVEGGSSNAASSALVLALQERIENQERNLSEAQGKRQWLEQRLQRAEDGRKADSVVFQEQIKVRAREMGEMTEKLRSAESKLEELESRKASEKQLGVQMRQQIATLKDELRQRDVDIEAKRESEKKLQDTIQRYVSEVKRVEEVLELKEREWLELLDQYKHLADEADSAESNGKSLQDTINSLERELATRQAALEASERQVFELEQDLMQVTAANESMRITIGDLSQRMEAAEGELKEAQEESYSVHSDLTNVHQLAIQLNSQKVELQQQIASQSLDMESMRAEMDTMRAKLEALQAECDNK